MPTRELMQSRADEYRSFVVRLSRTASQNPWRISVEVVSTRQQFHFRDAAALTEFFTKQMTTEAGLPAPVNSEPA